MSGSNGFWKPSSSVGDSNGTDENHSHHFNFSRAPLAQQRMLLPIYKHRRQIQYTMEHYGVVVIVGETGSGKSTQIPQYLYENGWADKDFQIVCTQPRRIAAQTLAQRVSEEVGQRMGGLVGYTVRFDDCTSPMTSIKYVTDGMLLREATLQDPLLSAYSVVMVDEAHERNLNSDALLGLLKKIRRKRKDLRVIICSATIDAEAFLNFFVGKSKEEQEKELLPPESTIKKRKRRWDNPTSAQKEDTASTNKEDIATKGTIISVDGRQHAVDILYLKEPARDYVHSTIDTALRIHEDEGSRSGDILCFLPSGEDIDRAIRLAEDVQYQRHQHDGSVDFLPLYGSLPYHMQARIFQPPTTNRKPKEKQKRRIILATNIAETSVTVPNVSHVVDCGLAKSPYFDPQTGFDRLIVVPISQASARQRAGRSGRIQSGKCWRLYTEQYLCDKMETSSPPEILRTNLTGFILTLKALGVDNVLAFDLLDLPSVEAISHGLECLYALNAIDDKTNLTKLGMDMSIFPTEPRIARMLLESIQLGCTWEIVAVASALQVSRQLFLRPKTSGRAQNHQKMLDYEAAIAEFADDSGDHVTYANIIADQDDKGGRMNTVNDREAEEECRERMPFINYRALRRAMDVRSQLFRSVKKYGRVTAMGLKASTSFAVADTTLERSRAIRKCVTAGFFFNVAKLGNDGRYYTLRKRILVTPSTSSVFHTNGKSCEYIVFCETHDGARGGIELRSVSAIDSRWLRELSPHYWN